MLLEQRWRETAERRANDWALAELASGRQWTFRQLVAAADRQPDAGGWLELAVGNDVGFILSLLRGWRAGKVICPLEPTQAHPKVSRPPEGVVHLKLTSGTTGAPQCVSFTAAQLAADADAIVQTMGLHPDSPNLGVISLAHSYGFSNLVLPLLLHGIPLVLGESAMPAAIAGAVEANQGRRFTLPAVPALWRTWQEAGVIPLTLHRAISAGAPLPVALELAVFQSTGVKLHNFLGASECGGIAYDATETPRTDPRLAGTPLVGVNLSVGSDGCLEVRSPAVGATYWPTPDSALGAGRFLSRDLVEWGSRGEVLLVGRAADVINVAGRKVSPEEVERALRTHSGVGDCLVLGVPADEARGEIVAAVVEARGGATDEELRTHLQRMLPAWQIPRLWRRVDSLNPNGRGKLSRREWRQRLLGEQAA